MSARTGIGKKDRTQRPPSEISQQHLDHWDSVLMISIIFRICRLTDFVLNRVVSSQ
jgi:hypothetical protein